MARTQLRLDSITGSLSSIEAAASGTIAAAPSAIAAGDLEAVLGQFAGAIKRIHGAGAFTNQVAGLFTQATTIKGGDFKVQDGSANDKFTVGNATGSVTGSAGAKFNADLDVGATAKIVGDVTVSSGDVILNKAVEAKVSTANDLKFSPAGGKKIVADLGSLGGEKLSIQFGGAEKAKFESAGTTLAGPLTVNDLSNTAGAIVFHDSTKKLIDNAGLKYDAPNSVFVAPKLQGTNLTATQVTYVDTDKSIISDAGMTYAAGTGLTLSKDLSARSGSFLGDLTVTGDLNIMGSTTYVNTQDLLVKDAKIVISSGSIVNGAGIYLGSDSNVDESIRWTTADGGKWIASDKFAADTIQALDLSSAPVAVDPSGNLVEMDFADWVLGTANQVIVTGSGTDLHGITLSLPQSINTSATVQFGKVFIDGATASDAYIDGGSQYLQLGYNGGSITVAQSGQTSLVGFTSTSIIGALNELAAGGGGGKGKWSKAILGAVPSPDASIVDMSAAMGSNVFPSDLTRVDIYLNGQMMTSTADYSISAGGASVDFTFDVAIDDVVVVVIR